MEDCNAKSSVQLLVSLDLLLPLHDGFVLLLDLADPPVEVLLAVMPICRRLSRGQRSVLVNSLTVKCSAWM